MKPVGVQLNKLGVVQLLFERPTSPTPELPRRIGLGEVGPGWSAGGGGGGGVWRPDGLKYPDWSLTAGNVGKGGVR